MSEWGIFALIVLGCLGLFGFAVLVGKCIALGMGTDLENVDEDS